MIATLTIQSLWVTSKYRAFIELDGQQNIDCCSAKLLYFIWGGERLLQRKYKELGNEHGNLEMLQVKNSGPNKLADLFPLEALNKFGDESSLALSADGT